MSPILFTIFFLAIAHADTNTDIAQARALLLALPEEKIAQDLTTRTGNHSVAAVKEADYTICLRDDFSLCTRHVLYWTSPDSGAAGKALVLEYAVEKDMGELELRLTHSWNESPLSLNSENAKYLALVLPRLEKEYRLTFPARSKRAAHPFQITITLLAHNSETQVNEGVATTNSSKNLLVNFRETTDSRTSSASMSYSYLVRVKERDGVILTNGLRRLEVDRLLP